MSQKSASVILFTLILLVAVDCQLQINVPRLTNIVNRITNTTFGLLRGGVNIFTKTVDRIINSFGKIEERLGALLEEFRKQIVKGIPEFNIPILDPLHVDKIEFTLNNDALSLKGHAEDVTVKHISKFIIDKVAFKDLGHWIFKLDLNITFPYLALKGKYDIDGLVGDSFKIFGNGKFWVHLINLKIGTSTILKFEYPLLKVTDLKVDLKLERIGNYFENLMKEKETEELINKAITQIAPQALDIIWPELKGPVEKQIKNYINRILENATVANLARRLFNIL